MSRGPAWTPAEDRILARIFPAPPATLQAALPHRTVAAIRRRATILDLVGRRGWVSLAKAARRAGYHPRTLAKILGRYGVGVQRPHGPGPRCKAYVRWVSALWAVERHLAMGHEESQAA